MAKSSKILCRNFNCEIPFNHEISNYRVLIVKMVSRMAWHVHQTAIFRVYNEYLTIALLHVTLIRLRAHKRLPCVVAVGVVEAARAVADVAALLVAARLLGQVADGLGQLELEGGWVALTGRVVLRVHRLLQLPLLRRAAHGRVGCRGAVECVAVVGETVVLRARLVGLLFASDYSGRGMGNDGGENGGEERFGCCLWLEAEMCTQKSAKI